MHHSELIASGKRVVEIEIEAIQSLLDQLDEKFALAVNALAESVSNNGKVVVVGVGKSGNIGHKIAATLNSTGSTAVVLNSQNALHGDLGIISDGDTVIADGKYTWDHKESGEPCEVRMAHIWTLADGKAISFLQHVDSATVRDLIS